MGLWSLLPGCLGPGRPEPLCRPHCGPTSLTHHRGPRWGGRLGLCLPLPPRPPQLQPAEKEGAR